jgi:hypothetical protein
MNSDYGGRQNTPWRPSRWTPAHQGSVQHVLWRTKAEKQPRGKMVAVPVLRKLRRVIEDDDDHTQGGSLLLQLSCLLLLFLLFAPGGWWVLLLSHSSLLQAAASKRGRRG